jgi:UDP-glucose 4-epimerase
VVGALVREGRSVRVLDDFSTGLEANLKGLEGRIDVRRGDVGDARAVAAAVAGVRNVFHLAARASVEESVRDPLTSERVNAHGVLNLLVASRDAGVDRFVFSSSCSVYGNPAAAVQGEDAAVRPLSPYAVQKLTGEHYCRVFRELYGLRTFALRYFNVFGPRQNPRSQYGAVVPAFIDALTRGAAPEIYGDGRQTRDFVFVEDVARANLCCREAPDDAAGGVYNIGSGRSTSVAELARLIGRITGAAVSPLHRDARPGDVRDSRSDPALARLRLGWEPRVSLEEGLRRTVEFLRARAAGAA